MARREEMAAKAAHPVIEGSRGALDRFEALLAEDQALRSENYDKPDPGKRRLKIACNECEKPWCCNQLVEVTPGEALLIWRWAAEHVPALLERAVQRGKELKARPPADDAVFFQRRVTCPLLDKEGRCGVYPVRPQNCREHYMGGNPMKCRDQLQPPETYAMNPDNTLLGELREAGADVQFEALVDGIPSKELAQALYAVDLLTQLPEWRNPTDFAWTDLGETAGATAVRKGSQRIPGGRRPG